MGIPTLPAGPKSAFGTVFSPFPSPDLFLTQLFLVPGPKKYSGGKWFLRRDGVPAFPESPFAGFRELSDGRVMSFEYGSARREFVKVSTEISVRYKFLSKVIDLGDDSIYEGTTSRIAASGCLLSGKIPSVSWIPGLLMGKIVIGVNILLPNVMTPVKALARVAWVEAIPEGSEKCTLGLTFKEISKEHQDELLRYMIRAQISR